MRDVNQEFFFAEMMKTQKYDEYSQGQEYLEKKQRKEGDTRRAHTDKIKFYWKQEYLGKKQESVGDTREYYAAKEELWSRSKQGEPG